jgi:hypothetical protein
MPKDEYSDNKNTGSSAAFEINTKTGIKGEMYYPYLFPNMAG